MQRAGVWVVSVVLLAGSLSVVVAMMTVQFLYPTAAAPVAEITAPPTPPSQALPAVETASASPVSVTPLVAPNSTDEAVAMEVIRLAGMGDLRGALALAPGLSEEMLQTRVGRVQPTPVRAGRLPGNSVLVWTNYRREGLPARGAYQVTVLDGKVTRVEGPFAPEGGYRTETVTPLDLNGRRLDLAPYAGKGIILIAPRRPEPGLDQELIRLEQEFAPQGVAVVLALDIGAPDWAGTAQQAGFTGPVWRFKSRLEDIPMVNQGRWLGAVGLLIDRDGYAVASLTALDPSRYDGEQPVAPTILKAYGLLP